MKLKLNEVYEDASGRNVRIVYLGKDDTSNYNCLGVVRTMHGSEYAEWYNSNGECLNGDEEDALVLIKVQGEDFFLKGKAW